MSVESNEAALRRAVDRWNAGDHDGYLALYDPAVVMRGHPDLVGLTGIRGFYEGIWTAFPGCRIEIDDVIGAGDKLAARFTLTGTHDGPLMGLPPTGRAIRLPGMTILRFADGRCVERWSQSDFLGLLQQIGGKPTP